MTGDKFRDEPVCPYSKIKDAFFIFDANADGTIAGTEAAIAARSCGISFEERALPEEFNEPEVTFEAFEAFLSAELAAKKPVEDLKKAFQALDNQKTGRISTAEFREILRACGSMLDAASIEQLVKAADKDNTGTIDYNTFAAFLLK